MPTVAAATVVFEARGLTKVYRRGETEVQALRGILFIGDNIVVRVVRVQGGTVRLGIEAPAEVPIRREGLASRSAGDGARERTLVESA